MKALILAAGFGSRLRPITNYLPKPLCPVYGVPLLDLAYHRVKAAGIEKIAVNTHYLSELVTTHLEANWLNIDYLSHEPSIRGTGGSIHPLISWLDGDDLLIYNGDILSDIDLNGLINFHRQKNAQATMALLSEHQAGKNPVLSIEQSVCGFGDTSFNEKFSANECKKNTFTGIHIISNTFARSIPDNIPWHIIDTYIDYLSAEQNIAAFYTKCFWYDLGTTKSYWKAHLDILQNKRGLLNSLGIHEMRRLSGMASLVWNPDSQSIVPISMNKQLNQDQIKHSVITNHLTIQEQAKLSYCLVFPDVKMLNQSFDQCIITAHDSISHT